MISHTLDIDDDDYDGAMDAFPERSPSISEHDAFQRADEHQDGGDLMAAFAEMVHPKEEDGRITVVIDAANVGWSYGVNRFDVDGLVLAFLALEDFKEILDVIAFIPASYYKKKPGDGTRGNIMMYTDDWSKLDGLVRASKVIAVPAGCSDDAFILKRARDNNGFVISNDHFVDHVASLEPESVRTSMKLWLRSSRVGYTFVRNAFSMDPQTELQRRIDVTRTDRLERAAAPADAVERTGGTLGDLCKPDNYGQVDWRRNAASDSASVPEGGSSSQAAALESLSMAITHLQYGDNKVALKHVLLARAALYIQFTAYQEAQRDLEYVCMNLHATCEEAQRMMDIMTRQAHKSS